mgnify:CR=1 FL=1
MTLYEQCHEWLEQKQFKPILESIEALPEAEHSFELDAVYAQALAALANPDQEEGASKLERVIELGQTHAEALATSIPFLWTVGYAHYALGNFGEAQRLLERAITLIEESGETEGQRLEQAKEMVRLATAEMLNPELDVDDTFRVKVAAMWKAFAAREAEWRATLFDEEAYQKSAQAMLDEVSDVLHMALADIGLEISVNPIEHRPEIVFVGEENLVLLHALRAALSAAPESITEHWKLTLGRAPLAANSTLTLAEYELDIALTDVRVWVERVQRAGRELVNLRLYHPQLASLALREDETALLEWLTAELAERAVGELVYVTWLGEVTLADQDTMARREDCTLETLLEKLTTLGINANPNDWQLLDVPSFYSVSEPVQYQDKERWEDHRFDIVEGVSSCLPFHTFYMQNDARVMDSLTRSGIVAGFMLWDMNVVSDEQAQKQLADLRRWLRKRLDEQAVSIIGSARGTEKGYLDLLIWDYPAFLDALDSLGDEMKLELAGFHTFYRRCLTLYVI